MKTGRWIALGTATWLAAGCAAPTTQDIAGRLNAVQRQLAEPPIMSSPSATETRRAGAVRPPADPTRRLALQADQGVDAPRSPGALLASTAMLDIELLHLAQAEPAKADSPDIPSGDLWDVLKHDVKRLPGDLWEDTKRLANTRDAVILLVAGGASLAVRETLDDDLAEETERQPHRWGAASDAFNAIGNPGHHFAAAAALYVYGIKTDDAELYDCAKTLTSALIITDLSTVFLKVAADSDGPNGEWGGWPSGHVASTICTAAVLEEYYGPWVGLAGYAVTGLVSWARIDDREHDLSDVVFGAALGYVVGKSVAKGRRMELLGMEVVPFVDVASGANGIALQKTF